MPDPSPDSKRNGQPDARPDVDADATITGCGSGHANTETGRAELDPEVRDDAATILEPSALAGELGRLGRYRVLRVLGRGGMGMVFEAEDEKLKRRVAIKAMLPGQAANASARKRFAREAEAAAKVEHDNIVPIYDIAELNGLPFLAMPLLVGEPLDGRLKGRQPLPATDVIAIGRDIAEGLAAAHAAGLIHRDIKPSNVWLERTAAGAFRRARILDFGLARPVGDTAGLTQSGAVVGTPAYMAPEQARGRAVDHRADLFSLGCVLYQMATGRRPFTGEDTLSVLTALATDTPAAPIQLNPLLPPALSNLIQRLMAKDADDRWPPTAQDVAAELLRVAGGLLATGPSGAHPPVVALPVRQQDLSLSNAQEVWSAAVASSSGGDVPVASSAEPSAPGGDAPKPAHAPPRTRGGRGPLYASLAVLLAVLALLGAAYGKTLLRIAANEGELLVEVDDPTVEVRIVRGGEIFVDRTKGRAFVIPAGSGEVQFLDPQPGAPGVARTFSLKAGGQETARATLADVVAARPRPRGKEEPVPSRLAVDHTKGLQWVLTVGGSLEIIADGSARKLSSGDKLPDGPFEVSRIDLRGLRAVDDTALENLRAVSVAGNGGLNLQGTGVADAGLAKLSAFPGFGALGALDVQGAALTDAGMPHLGQFPNLSVLSLNSIGVTDAGLEYLRGLKLTTLHLDGCKITGTGFVHVQNMASLRSLQLNGCPVQGHNLVHLKGLKLESLGLVRCLILDGGLEHLADMTSLSNLGLSHVATDKGLARLTKLTALSTLSLNDSAGVTDAALETVARLTDLGSVDLSGTKVTDAGLAKFRLPDKLTSLALERTRVTDEGLKHLSGCKSLKTLSLNGTGVTQSGVEEFAKAVPNCKIVYDGGVTGPKATPEAERKALEWVLSRELGLVNLSTPSQVLSPRDKLPAGAFEVSGVVLRGPDAVDDATIDNLRPVTLKGRAPSLSLQQTRLTDAGIAKLATFPGFADLNALDLENARITDAAVPHLARFKALGDLRVAGTGVTDAGLEHLRDMPLTTLILDHCRGVTGSGFIHLRGMKNLVQLHLDDCPVAGKHLAHLVLVPLVQLRLSYCRIDDEGLENLADIPSLKTVNLASQRPPGGVTDKGVAKLAKLKDLRELILLGNANVTDAALDHLAACASLAWVDAKGTKVTKAGAEKLARALPNCKIDYEGGVIEPKK